MVLIGQLTSSNENLFFVKAIPTNKKHSNEPISLTELLSNDKDAFQSFYQSYSTKIFNIALGYTKNKEDAEEIVQDVFVKIYQSAASFKGESSVSTWVYRITVNKCLDFLRKQRTKKRFSFLLPISDQTKNKVSDFKHPGIDLEHQENLAVIFKGIDLLPNNQKTAFILSFIEDLPRQEVADIMELSLKAVESLLQRGKKKLRENLEKHYPSRRKLKK